MKTYIFFLIFFSALSLGQVQSPSSDQDTIVVDNGKKDSLKIFRPTISDYKFKTQFGEEKTFDTAFSVYKTYAYTQYNNRDNFGKVQFANIGAGFQDLVFVHNPEQNLTLLPAGKSHFIFGINDIKYYDVKTPTTSFIYHTAMRNGAALQTTYTQNIGKNFNFSVEYMGLRSQGFYTHSLAANNSTIVSVHYKTKNQKYEVYGHFVNQNVNNNEYGGISTLDTFLSGDSRFDDRRNIAVNLNDSDSRYNYKRFYYSHSFSPFTNFPFKLRHSVYLQNNTYNFNLGSSDFGFFESVSLNRNLGSEKLSKNFSNTVSLLFDNERFKLDAGVGHQSIFLLARNQLLNSNQFAAYESRENRIGAVGNLKINLWEKFALNSFLEFSRGSQLGNYLRTVNRIKFEPIKDYFVDSKVNFQSAAPSFNFLMNASPILNYNYNFTDFRNENLLELGGTIGLKWFNTQLFANYFRIDNFAYFTAQGLPMQSDTSLNISQIGGDVLFSFGKFHLNKKLLFQSNLTNKELYPIPSIVGRANIFYQNEIFKNAAEIMTGIKVHYFSRFNSRDFSPVLNEFILPNSRAYVIGGQPYFDAYVNLKVKTMQIFVEAQNFTTTFTQNRVYTAPYYPIYDFRLNIGVVWNLFH